MFYGGTNKRALRLFGVSFSVCLLFSPLAVEAAGDPTSLLGKVTEQEALDATLLKGPRASAARAQLDIARALIPQAKILPNPALEFDNGYAELSYRAGVAVPIQPPWKLVLRLAAAKAQVSSTNLQMLQNLWLLRADARRAYTELVVAEESASMMRNLSGITQTLAAVASKRFDAGDVAKLDVYKAELAYSQAQIEANQAERRIVQAREQLNIIMGRSEDSDLQVPRLSAFELHAERNELLPNLAQPLPPLSQFIAEALRDRLDVKLINQELVTTAANRKLTLGNIWPDAQLSVGFDYQKNPAPEHNLSSAYFMGSLPLPILDRQQGELARLKATRLQLQSELASQQNIVRGQVALAYRKLWNARENIRKYQESVLEQSEKVSDLGRLSYRLGQTDITSALTAQQSNIQVRSLYLNDVLNYQQYFTDLEQAVGHVLQ